MKQVSRESVGNAPLYPKSCSTETLKLYIDYFIICIICNIFTSMKTSFLLLLALVTLRPGKLHAGESVIQFNETYELANIILAITEYGKNDFNEVNKNSDYYQEILAHFDPYKDHPIMAKVNYSRELWDKLLSFRTDAVAFEFDAAGSLHRVHKFYAMGKDINEFEDNLALVEDFARISGFRAFYADKKAYYERLRVLYDSVLYIPAITTFLSETFNQNIELNHQIIVSPLVGRMNCQRTFNNKSTSFINIPDQLFTATHVRDIPEYDIAIGVHMFFTEIDHDYVNPASEKHKKQIKACFDPAVWDKGSGYENYKLATFNEYMTWAVYDLFVYQYFPDYAAQAASEWHDINASRGFFASKQFGAKLVELYQNKSTSENINDLYPKLLDWCLETSTTLTPVK